MNKLIIAAFVLSAVLGFTCKKAGTTPKTDQPSSHIYNNNLSGSWRWLSSTGGIAGITQNPANTGKQMMLTFSVDSTYKGYVNNVVSGSGTFSIAIGVKYGSSTVDLVKYSNSSISQSYKISSDTLFLIDYGISDGFSHKYVRIN